MHRIWAIARKDIREAFRSRSTYVYIAILFFLTFTYSSSYNSLISRLTAENASQAEIYATSRSFLINIVYIIPTMYSFFVCTIFAAYAVIVEKSKRNIESLMVTPLTLRQLWIGKTLAVTVPSVLVALGVSVISYIAMNFILVVPRTDSFILPNVLSVVTAVIIVPVLTFAIVLLVIYLQLVMTNPRIANLAFTGIFLVLLFGANFLTGVGIVLNYSVIYIALAAVIGGITYLLGRSMTKEKVILSSKT
jgi:ABC-2 type transport system permease protein